MKDLIKEHILYFILLFICVVILAVLIDFKIYSKRFTLDSHEVICWITQELEAGDCNEINLPPVLKLVSQEELENQYVENALVLFDNKDLARAQIELSILIDKVSGLYIRGFHCKGNNSVYISSESESVKDTHVHELVHYVINVVDGGSSDLILMLKEDNDQNEKMVKDLARKYIIEHRWSARVLSWFGLV